jgi:hypothetical protein
MRAEPAKKKRSFLFFCGGIMKRILFVALILVSFFGFASCRIGKESPEVIRENGLEIVINHRNQVSAKKIIKFHLNSSLSINSRNDAIADIGLGEITDFDIDSEGNIYISNRRNSENVLYKFDKVGNFVTAFGKKGQGPGEIQSLSYFCINSNDEIEISDTIRRKLTILSKVGKVEREMPIGFPFQRICSLRNGNYLAINDISDINGDFIIQLPLVILDSNLSHIKEIDRYRIPNYLKGRNKKGTSPVFFYALSNDSIYVVNDERDYEIWVFDLSGKMKKKIRREYSAVRLSREYINERLNEIDPKTREITYFPKYFPPFARFFLGDKGDLYIQTYEKDKESQSSRFDIISSEGVLTGQCVFEGINTRNLVKAMGKSGRMFFLIADEDGYKQLLISGIASSAAR